MDLSNSRNTFMIKLLVLNFIFIGSFVVGKSVYYMLADFLLFAFIATLIYVKVVAFIERKRLAPSEEPTEYISR